MAFFKPKVSRDSGRPLLKGNLSVLSSLSSFIDNLDEITHDAQRHAANAAHEDIRTTASNDPLWEPHADNVGVTLRDSHLVYSFNGTSEQVQNMTNLEYGGESNDPVSLLRRKAFSPPFEVSKHLNVKIPI